MNSDLVSETFEAMRKQARRHGHAPDLSKQGRSRMPRRSAARSLVPQQAEDVTVPGVELGSVDKPKSAGHRGIPTGSDGRRRRRSQTVSSLGSIVGKEIVERGWQHEMAKGWVTTHWAYLVGESIAQHAHVEMVKEQTIFISCDSTAWATNLRYMQKTILQKIAKKVGPNVIAKLQIFGPSAPSWKKGRLHVSGRGPRDTYG